MTYFLEISHMLVLYWVNNNKTAREQMPLLLKVNNK